VYEISPPPAGSGGGGAVSSGVASGGAGSGSGAGGGTTADAGAPLVSEAGFLDVPAHGPFLGAARMFYSFRPADQDPAHAPVVVFFNGGPGGATSGGLLPGGTGPRAVVSAAGLAGAPFDNPASWTSFANLLYLDERTTGFSYGQGTLGCTTTDAPTLYVADASDFVEALLDFLDQHPAIAKSPVVIAGESYGATRATLIASFLQNYAAPSPPGGAVPRPPELVARVQAHVDAIHPELHGAALDAEGMAKQFGHVVFIEGNVGGNVQFMIEAPLNVADPILGPALQRPGVDQYDVRLTKAEDDAISAGIAATMRDPAGFEAITGIAPAAVPGLPASQRGDAVRSFVLAMGWPGGGSAAQVAALEASMQAALGPLGPDDAYYLPVAPPCDASFLGDVATLWTLAELLGRTAFFITRARFDGVVDSDGWPVLFGKGTWQATVREDLPAGAARPGVLELVPPGSPPLSIRFPKYDAGHMVAMTAGPALHDDVRDWLAADGTLPH
jgi:hypothetical protein